MANRTGIELLPYVCRIVEVRTGSRLFGGGPPSSLRVRAFHEIPYSAADPALLTAELRRVMKGLSRRAAVAVWGLRSVHQAMRLPPAEPDDLAAVARREARAVPGSVPAGPLADGVVIGNVLEDGRREVGYAAVGSEELHSRLQPLVDAGLSIETALTPALAHASLVRQRRSLLPDAVVAVLSINGRATALTVLRGRVVLFARELPWGDETDALDGDGRGPAVTGFAGRIAAELRRSLVYLRQNHKVEVSRVLVCGDMPDLRSLTAPLTNELSLDVETLDVADDLDLSDLPEPSEGFRSRLAEWRTALALAAEAAPPVGLERHDAAPARSGARLLRRLGMAAAAGLLIAAAGWGLVNHLSARSAADAQRLRRAIGTLEPELQRQDEDRRDAALAAARGGAMRAFAAQGPRLARVLEVFSRAAPADVALTTLDVKPGVGSWRITAEGQVEGADAAAAQAAFSQFLKALDSSTLLGRPLAPPSLRIRTADATVEGGQAAVEPPAAQGDRALQEVDVRQPAPTGPAYIEVARDGRLYRIPLRRQSGGTDFERENEIARRQAAMARQQPAARAQTAAGAGDALVRHPASVIDFTLQYEVRK